MEIKRYESALEDINKLLDADFENSEAHYFKGLIFSKLSILSSIQNNPTMPSSAMNRQSSIILIKEL